MTSTSRSASFPKPGSRSTTRRNSRMRRGPREGPRNSRERIVMAVDPTAPALEIRGMAKAFPGVQALRGVSFAVGSGEVHAVVGENGAGKSPLMKILAGALAPDQGSFLVGGRVMPSFSPEASRRAGVAIIYQEFNLIPHLSVADNICLGREPGAAGWIDRRGVRAVARRWLSELEAGVSAGAEVGSR